MVLTTVNGLVAGDPIVDGTFVNQARAFQPSIPTQALGSYVTPLAGGYNFDALAMPQLGAALPFTQAHAGRPIDAFGPAQPFQQKDLSTWSDGDVYKAVSGNQFGAKQPTVPYNAEFPVTQIDALPTRKVYDGLAFRQYRQTVLSRWQAINPVANPALPDATKRAVIESSMAYANVPEVSAPIG